MTEADFKIEAWLLKLADAYNGRAETWDKHAHLERLAGLEDANKTSEKLALMCRDSAYDIHLIIKEHYEKKL